MQALGVYGDVEIVTRWWLPLQEAGYDVELRPLINDLGVPERDGRVYRGGFVRKAGVRVRIITTPALCPFSKHPLSGQPALFVGYGCILKSVRARRKSLAEEIIAVLVNSGLRSLGSPSDHRSGGAP